jgi:hypothetical protein
MPDNLAELIATYAEDHPELIQMDGFEDCAIGLLERFGQPPIIVYDRRRVIAKLMAQGMTDEEAEEYYGFNQLGAWVGEYTPAFLVRPGA